MGDKITQLIEYGLPPVTEVVCGVMFASLSKLLAPHLGLLWERYKPNYSECQEVPPIVGQIENPERLSKGSMDVFDVFTTPRVWFMEPNGNRLVQIQRDRFHHNWRKINTEDEYPRHELVLQLFNERFETFRNFLSEYNLGELQLSQYEMTYVNHILPGSNWNSLADISRVFPDFSWQNRSDRPSGVPKTIHWQTVFALPKEAGQLHVTIRSGAHPDGNQPILLFELTARSTRNAATIEDMISWFEMAHNQIVGTFADLVDIEFQRVSWGRKS